MPLTTTMSYVDIGVSQLNRSVEFYTDLLGFSVGASDSDPQGRAIRWLADSSGAERIRLVEVGENARSSGWDSDDLQCGIRHFGLKVGDADAVATRLRNAGVYIAAGPFDAFGGVRICFFYDPDGAYLELVQGHVQHNELWSAELAEAEVAAFADWDGSPRFDHVAVTVPDLDMALATYRDQLGFGVVGQLVRSDDPRGFLITNMRAGQGTLEVFTYTDPTFRRDSVGEPDRLGVRAVGLQVDGDPARLPATAPVDVPLVVDVRERA